MPSKQLPEEPGSEDRVHNSTQRQAGQGLGPASCVTWGKLLPLSELLCNRRILVLMATRKATGDMFEKCWDQALESTP